MHAFFMGQLGFLDGQVPEPEFLGAPPVAECGTPPAALLDKSLGCHGRGEIHRKTIGKP